MSEKLAIHGGEPVRKKPFPRRIFFNNEELNAVLRVMKKAINYGTHEALDRYAGDEVDLYEKEFAEYFGIRYATAVSSGTAAIHSILGALRLNPGDEVITTPITDPGTVAPILHLNLIPVFADVNYETLNISAKSIEKNITKKTKVIIPVHLAGQPCDMNPILEVAEKYNLVIIEDCAQAHGSKYNGKFVGTIGNAGAFSLMSGKHMTSGGQGGMIITNNEELYWNAKRFADRGKPFGSNEKTNLFLGLNYRMTQLQAAIGRVQLNKLDKIKRKRIKILRKLKKGLNQLESVSFWKIIDKAEINPWFLFIHYNKDVMKVNKEQFVAALSAEGIPVGAHYITILYEQKWIKEKKTYGISQCPWRCPYGRYINYTHSCPNAERALEDHFTLYIHEGWTDKEIEDTLRAFEKVERAFHK